MLTAAGIAWGLSPLSDDLFQERAVRDAVEVSVFGADGDRGVPEFFDGAFDAVYGDHISYCGTVPDVASGRDVAGEEGEALAQGEGGDEADGGEHDDGQEHDDVGLEAELGRGEKGGDDDDRYEDYAAEGVRTAQFRAFGLASHQLGEPPRAHHTRYQDHERHEGAAREVDDLVHGALQGGEPEDAKGAGHPGQHDAPEQNGADQARGAALVPELPEGVGGPRPLEEILEPEALEETGRQPLEEQSHDERHQERHRGADEARHELGQRAHKVVGGLRHQVPPP